MTDEPIVERVVLLDDAGDWIFSTLTASPGMLRMTMPVEGRGLVVTRSDRPLGYWRRLKNTWNYMFRRVPIVVETASLTLVDDETLELDAQYPPFEEPIRIRFKEAPGRAAEVLELWRE
jgi:hypothetical protein